MGASVQPTRPAAGSTFLGFPTQNTGNIPGVTGVTITGTPGQFNAIGPSGNPLGTLLEDAGAFVGVTDQWGNEWDGETWNAPQNPVAQGPAAAPLVETNPDPNPAPSGQPATTAPSTSPASAGPATAPSTPTAATTPTDPASAGIAALGSLLQSVFSGNASGANSLPTVSQPGTNGIDPLTGVPYTDEGIDPVTGVPYASEQPATGSPTTSGLPTWAQWLFLALAAVGAFFAWRNLRKGKK